MDKSNYFIKDTARFGAYPTQKEVEILEQNGVQYFLDLTYPEETNTKRYSTIYNYENFPIKDNDIPRNSVEFSNLIIRYSEIIENLNFGEKIYIHCRGGHGRSGLVAACLLVYIYNITPENAMYITTKGHCNRETLSEKWRTLSSPQSRKQRIYVLNFFKPLYLFTGYRPVKKGFLGFAEKILEIYYKIDKTEFHWHHTLFIEMATLLSEKKHKEELIITGLRKIIFNYPVESKMLISKYLENIRLDFIKILN